MFCTKCGNKLDGDVRFCTRCGAPVESGEAAAAATASVAAVSPNASAIIDGPTSASEAVDAPATPEAPTQRKSKKKAAAIVAAVTVVIAALALIFVFVISPGIGNKEDSAAPEQTPQAEQVASEDDTSSPTSDDASSTPSAAQTSQGSSGEQTTTDDYTVTASGSDKTYTNERHGYSITVPSSYTVVANDSGDKLAFTDAANSMTITLSCSKNVDNLSVKQAYDKLASGKNVSYKFVGSESCVASYLIGDMEYYDKAIVGKGSILYITFKYPHANNATCDKLLEKIVVTIKPGDLSSAHHI